MLKKSDYIYRAFLFVCSTLFMLITTNQVLSGKLNLAPKNLTKFNDLNSFADKFQFSLFYLCIPVLLLNFQIILTILKRVHMNAIYPSFENEKIIYFTSMILRNFTEQFIISAFSQLVFINFLSSKQTSQFIPLINLFFVIGRITFWIGYPKSRAFGIFLNALPSFLICIYSTLKFAIYLNYLPTMYMESLESKLSHLINLI